MIEYTEVTPLPAVCAECKEEECYNCDHLLERWGISTADEEKLKSLLAKQAERHGAAPKGGEAK